MLQWDNVVVIAAAAATAATAAAAAGAAAAAILVVVAVDAAAVAKMRHLVVAATGEQGCVGSRQLRDGCVECGNGAGAAHAQHGAAAAISCGRVKCEAFGIDGDAPATGVTLVIHICKWPQWKNYNCSSLYIDNR